MKKNGFIATSLLYSFFLIFIFAIVSLVAILLHNKIALNKISGTVKYDLTYLNKKTIININKGEYIKMPLFSNASSTNLSDTLWLVTNRTLGMVFLVSADSVYQTNKHSNVDEMQGELDKHYNNYTIGFDVPGYHNVTYLKRSELDIYEDDSALYNKTAVLGDRVGNSYIYYDDQLSQFKLRTYCGASCNPYNKVLTPGQNAPLRMSVSISENTPLSGGKGLLDDPYILAFYDYSDANLQLHYDYKNNTGNISTKNVSFTDIVDLSGTNSKGTINNRYSKISGTGIRINGTDKIDTKLNIYNILNNNYTIEFNTTDSFSLSTTSTPSGIITYNKSGSTITLQIMGSTFTISNNVKTNNTISLVKNGANRTIYLNGENVGTFPVITASPSDILYVGNNSAGAKVFKSIRIYKKALTSDEIKSNYDVDKRWL